jgi:cytochrome c peroxidase
MKKRSIVCFALFILLISVSALKRGEDESPTKKATALFMGEVSVLGNRIKALDDLLHSGSCFQKINRDSIRARLLLCRIAYKKIEWAMCYYFPSLATRINGTDFMEEEEPSEFEPAHGLQVIENIVLQKNPPDSAQTFHLHDELNRLSVTVSGIKEAISLLSGTTTPEFLAALKFEIMKVSLIGLTEYDNPIEKNYLRESATSLISVYDNVKLFGKLTSSALQAKTDLLFRSAINSLQTNKSPDAFNRLDFITNHYMPLSLLVDEYAAEQKVSYASYNPYVNLEAKSIFDIRSFRYFYHDANESNQSSRATLGKYLFFDPLMSGNYKRACASCHKPEKTFTDGLSKSLAFESGQVLTRNAPTLLNTCMQASFFDDSREVSLEGQIAAVVNNRKELNNSFEVIISRLEQSKEYSTLFNIAFPNEPITASHIELAIADYERTLESFNSDFDKYMKGDKRKLSTSQKNGFNLFMGKAKCGTCHFAPLFNGMLPPLYNKSEFEVIGALETNDFAHPLLDPDEGAGPLKKAAHLKFGFKVPGLRNAALTAPYMHNGALKTLSEVVAFYNKGGAAGFNLDLSNQTLSRDSLGLSKKQMTDIIHFIESLTDTVGFISKAPALPFVPGHPRISGGEY